ncbi:peptidylprolyl isomerase [Henriciella barbarensis]|uniref:Peptidyl-prolyl cis-trans isomerase n=1 Tax=Henriciella barbarensis TaxID=86342 RepID=A0A399QS04_9PROT|nr:peptidylprolyl isomerase [Henriciella barbarensis]RIJ20452.1 peptidylprolyl isomerase [Henriciella barbarensis]
MRFSTFAVSTLVLAGMAGATACAQGTSEAPEPPVFTVEDVEASPDAWRQADPANLMVMETTKGRIIIEMLPEVAPAHAQQFRTIASEGKWDGTKFHRVIDDFMAQGGDIMAMNGEGSGLPSINGEFTFRANPGEMPMNVIGPRDSATQGLYMGFPMGTQAQFLAELTGDAAVERWIPHCAGVVSTARTGDPNSANSQFFLMRHQGDHLDKQYTAWGRVVDGFDVVRSIKHGPAGTGVPINNPDQLTRAYMVSDLPEGEQPQVFVQRTDTEEWTARLAEADQTDTDICDVMRVPAVVAD